MPTGAVTTPPGLSGTYLDALSFLGTSGDIEAVILALAADRANALDSTIRSQVQDMKLRNERINALNSALNELRTISPTEANGKDFRNGSVLSTTSFNTLNGIKLSNGSTVASLLNDSRTGVDEAGDFEKIQEAIKTEIDSQSSSSQLEMIQLQGFINKRNQMVELMSNLIQKFSQLGDKVIGNMR